MDDPAAGSPEQAALHARLCELIQANGTRADARRIEEMHIASTPEGSAECASPASNFSASLVYREEGGFELWLGSLEDALCMEGLRLHGINSVFNCALEECERECAVYRSRGGGGRGRCRTHARGPSAMDPGREEGMMARRLSLDRDQIRALALFDSEWYSDMLDYDITYGAIAAEDEEGYTMSEHFDDAAEFIGQCRREGRKTLVHCIMGINRSSAALVAFLCKELGMRLPDAVGLASESRGYILSNSSFLEQLVCRFGAPCDERAACAAYAASGPTMLVCP